MDRFLIDDVGDGFDAVEPLRPSSFDMSFTLSTSGEGSYQDPRNPLHVADFGDDARARRRTGTTGSNSTTTTNSTLPRSASASRLGSSCAFSRMNSNNRSTVAHGHYDSDDDEAKDSDGNASSSAAAAAKPRRTTLLHDTKQSRYHSQDDHHFSGYTTQLDAVANEMNGMRLKTGNRKNVTNIAEKLEEKAQEAMQLSSLVSKMSWKLTKRMQDVHVYRPSIVSDEDATKVTFRVSCEVKASLLTVMEYLSPRDSQSFFDVESKVFPGLLHATVIKKMEIPTREASPQSTNIGTVDGGCVGGEKENVQSPHSQVGSSVDTADFSGAARAPTATSTAIAGLPRLHVKWHASRFAGRFVKPVDFFYVEYANIDTLPDGRRRGYGYLRSVESFKGDELATRLNSEKVSIPPSVSKCKRAVINKGVFMVTPTSSSSSGHGGSSSSTSNSSSATGTYEVTLMMVIDFQEQFSSAVCQKIIHNFTSRLIGIREQLYKTLFQPVSLITKSEWKDARATRCALCRCAFSIVKMRHHCRSCGEAVCGQCSRKWVVQPGTSQKENQTRLCTSCSLQARSFLRPQNGKALSSTGSGGGSTAGDRDVDSPERTILSRFDSQEMAPSSSTSASASSSAEETSFRSTMRVPPLSGGSSVNMPQDALFRGDVSVASVITSEEDPAAAARVAFESLVSELGGQAPHLMIVSYSHFHDGHRIHKALAQVAPDTLFMGGTSSGGVFTDAGSIDAGPALGLWGIYDPEGSYTVLNADLTCETPQDGTKRCITAGMRLLCLEPSETPDFIWMSLSTGTEEVVVKAVNQVVDCTTSIVGGGSYFVPSASARHPATQICSEGSERGWVTTHGLSFAVCSPSVEVAHACFTCYEPKDKLFTVTKAIGREVQTLDNKPAFVALNEGCRGMLHEYTYDPARFDLDKTKLPLYYPLARQRHESRLVKMSKYQVIQPFQALGDGSLVVGSEVVVGEKLRIMSVSAETVGERMMLGFREALSTTIPVIEASNVVGCVLTVSSNYASILNHETHAMALATARTFKNGSVLGSVSTSQQGVLLCTNEASHANAMVTSLLITNRKKALKLNPLRPLLLRRFSTY